MVKEENKKLINIEQKRRKGRGPGGVEKKEKRRKERK